MEKSKKRSFDLIENQLIENQSIEWIDVQIKYVRNDTPNKALYSALVSNNRKSMIIYFINILSPKNIVSPTILHPRNIAIKLKMPYRIVTEWKFANKDDHELALKNIEEYRATFLYEMSSQQIKAIQEFNSLILKKRWLNDLIKPFQFSTMETEPWLIVEWEQKLQSLGICRESHSLFSLQYCDKIGIKFNISPLENSRLHQYCKYVLQTICMKTGSTMVAFDYYIKEAVIMINQTNMIKSANIKSTNIKYEQIKYEQIRQLTLHYNNSFYVGRTNMQSTKLLISLRKIWDAQNSIVETLYNMCYPFKSPYYTERTLLMSYIEKNNSLSNDSLPYDVIHNIIVPYLWFNQQVHECIESFALKYSLVQMDPIQRKAIHAYWNEAVSIVSGGPGRGKSSCVLKAMLYVAQELCMVPLLDPNVKNEYTFAEQIAGESDEFIDDLLAPYTFVYVISFTGKAVSRIKEILSNDFMFAEPMTIHRLLSKCRKDTYLRRQRTHIFIDEVSMVPDMLFYQLLQCFEKLEKIVLLGDYDQLPPIQPGNLLKELIESRCVCVTRLMINYRQGPGSQLPLIADKLIGRECHGQSKRIWGGWDHVLNISVPKQKNSMVLYDFNESMNDYEFKMYSKTTNESMIFDAIREKVIQLRDVYKVDLHNDCLVLVAKRIEVAKLNAHLQNVFLNDLNDMNDSNDPNSNNSLNERIVHKYENIEFGFRHNDRIMYLENDYEQDMFNGDIMRVVDLDFNNRKLMVIGMMDQVSTNSLNPNPNPNQVKLEDVQPAYALTTHKAQGSEFKYVIIYIGQENELLHNDQWLYTAFTRGKQQVIVFGYREEIEQTIKREMPARRTFLRHRMQLRFSKRLKDLLRNELQNVPI